MAFVKFNFFRKPVKQLWFVAILSSILISALLSVVNLLPAITYDPRYFFRHITFFDLLGTFITWVRYIAVWIIVYFMHKILQQNNIIRQEKLALENLAKSTELELLKIQLNPHFLFNALNSIKALVGIDSRKSKDAIVKLSELLRFTLQYGKEQLILVELELSEVKKYFELEQLRFADRLKVSYDINENSLNMWVPPAIILILAENAVKHGVAKTMGECRIHVGTTLEKDFLVISVDNYCLQEIDTGKGIGLRLIVKRLDEIYQNKGSFTLQKKGEFVCATIKIPI